MGFSSIGHPNTRPHSIKGTFLCRLPNIADNHVLIFGYDDRSYDYKGSALEMQIFDETNQLLDKIILVDMITYECGFHRSFELSKSYALVIHDQYSCYDMENDYIKILSESNFNFQVTAEGSIVSDKSSSTKNN